MTFAYPILLTLLLLIPLLAWLKHRWSREAAFLYSSVQLLKRVTNLRRSPHTAILRFMRWTALAFLIIGLAQPRLQHGEASLTASGIDIMVAMDLSGSMAAEDFRLEGRRVNRLAVAKDVLEEFIQQRPSDRIGLVAFAGEAYVAAPLTLDHGFLRENLKRLELGLIEDGTAIGAGLSTALNRLREVTSESKIVILMTDGQETVGSIPPMTAAEAAERLGVKVYTIGVGTRGTAPMPAVDPFGRQIYREVEVDIDEETLQAIADQTGGQYYRADASERLRDIYREIDRLEKTEITMDRYRQYEELFYWPLTAGLVLLLLEIVLTHTIWRKLP